MTRRHTGKWCWAADKPCPRDCPIPSIDNFGNPYPGCALVRLKSLAEMGLGTDASLPAGRPEAGGKK